MVLKPLYCIYGRVSITQRVICAIMLQFALINAYHFRIVLNVAITEMQQTRNESGVKIVDACPNLKYQPVKVKEAKFKWSNGEEAFILYAFYIGYLISQLPGGWLCDIVGARHVLGTCLLFSAVVNIFYPLAISQWGKIPAIILRIVIGFAQGPILPASASFMQCWVPNHERTFLAGIAYGGTSLGTVTGSIFTGLMIKNMKSWHGPFYVWSTLAIVWYVIYLFTVFSRPSTHPFITSKELSYLEQAIQKKKNPKVPWKKILTSSVVWALMCGQFSGNMIFFTLLTDLPKYLKEILKMDVKNNAIYTALPFGLQWFSNIVCAYVVDRIIEKEILSVLTMRRICTILAALLPAIILLIVGYIGCRQIPAVVLFAASIVCMGPFVSGVEVNINDISINFSGIIMALVNGFASLSGILGPLLVGMITKDHSLQSWQLMFWIIFGISMATLTLYVIFTSSERQAWDYLEENA